MPRSPKKSETLEIRLPFETKAAFMARCRRDGLTASEALRGFIEARLESPARRRVRSGWRGWIKAGAGAAVLLAAGGAALPSVAASLDRAGFASLDADHSGDLSLSELSAADLTVQTRGVALAGSKALEPALRARLARATFDACDADHNGALSFEEFRRGAI